MQQLSCGRQHPPSMHVHCSLRGGTPRVFSGVSHAYHAQQLLARGSGALSSSCLRRHGCKQSPGSYRRCLTVSALHQDQVYKSVVANNEVTCTVVLGTELVQEACKRHGTAPTASAALGRLLMGTLLLGVFREAQETTQVTFKGQGVLGELQAVATAEGLVKGKVTNPSADPPLQPDGDGKLNVGKAVGKGFLAVVRNHSKNVQSYTGMVPLSSGEIAEDLANYLADSEQVNSALGLGVSIGRDASVRAAGGFLIQVLPFASEETLQALEKSIAAAPPVSLMLEEGLGARDISKRLLGDLDSSEPGFGLTPRYGPCDPEDLKARMRRAVAALGKDEVADIVAQEGKIEILPQHI